MSPVRVVITIVMLWAATAVGECLPSGRSTFAAGLEALNRGDLKAALTRFEELVQAQPDCAEARNNLAVVLFEMGLTERADAELRQVVELHPDYPRARANLRRVESSFRGAAPKPEIEAAFAGDATPVPTAVATQAPAATAQTSPTLRATMPAVPSPQPTVPAAPAVLAVPAQLAALEPVGGTACVIDATQKRLCVYRRAETGIVQDTCAPIVQIQVATWPQWVTASDRTAKRIRLVDDTLQRRLRVVPDAVAMDDSVRLRQHDFDALSGKMLAWRSGWVVLQPNAPVLSTAAAAQTAKELREALERWRQAWEGKQLDAYTGFYSPSFAPPDGDAGRWRARKSTLFQQSGAITVRVAAPSIFVLGDGSTAIATFEQTYRSAGAESRDFKAVRWQRQAGRWQISAETVLADRSPARPARRRRGG